MAISLDSWKTWENAWFPRFCHLYRLLSLRRTSSLTYTVAKESLASGLKQNTVHFSSRQHFGAWKSERRSLSFLSHSMIPKSAAQVFTRVNTTFVSWQTSRYIHFLWTSPGLATRSLEQGWQLICPRCQPQVSFVHQPWFPHLTPGTWHSPPQTYVNKPRYIPHASSSSVHFFSYISQAFPWDIALLKNAQAPFHHLSTFTPLHLTPIQPCKSFSSLVSAHIRFTSNPSTTTSLSLLRI